MPTVPDWTSSPETRGPTVSTRWNSYSGAEGVPRLLHDRALRRLPARLDREAQGHAAGSAELLHLDLAEPEALGGLANLADVGPAGFRLQLHERAAPEVDAEIEAEGHEQQDGDDGYDGRERERPAPKVHEIEVRVLGPEAY